MNSIAKNHSWITILALVLLINTLLFGAFFMLLKPAYETNDDIGTMLTVSGIRTGEPSEYLVYTNVIIGQALKYFYERVPNINWYTLYLFAAHILAMTAILFSVLKKKLDRWRILQYILLFVFFECALLMRLQFTSTAFMAALGGLCLLLVALEEPGIASWLCLMVSVLLFGLAGLIRHEVFYFAMLLSAPLLLLKYWETKSLKLPVFIVLSALILFSAVKYNDYYYHKDPEWGSYIEYNHIRGQLHGYPKLVYNAQTQPVFSKIGWSKNDFLMFRNRMFYDQNVFSRDKLAFINHNLKYRRNIQETAGVLFDIFLADKLLIFAAGIFLMLSIIFIEKSGRRQIYAVIFPVILLSIYFAHSARLPFRIYMPMLMFLSAMMLMVDGNIETAIDALRSKKTAWLIIPIVAALLLILIGHVIELEKMSKADQMNDQRLSGYLKALPAGKDKLNILLGGHNLPVELTPPFSSLAEYRGLNLLFSGWIINSPFNKEMMQKFGIKNVFLPLPDDRKVFLVASIKYKYMEMIEKFMAEHYRHKVRYELIGSYKDMGIFIALPAGGRN